MLVAFDGPSCAGKSTLIGHLLDRFPKSMVVAHLGDRQESKLKTYCLGRAGLRSEIRRRVVDWVDDFERPTAVRLREAARTIEGMEPRSCDDELRIQALYEPMFRARQRALIVALDRAPLVFADRSVWAFYAYAFGRGWTVEAPCGGALASVLRTRLAASVVPHLSVFLLAAPAVRLQRAEARGDGARRELTDPSLLTSANLAYRTLGESLGTARAMVLDGGVSSLLRVHRVTGRIQETPMNVPAKLQSATLALLLARLGRSGTETGDV